MDKIVNKEDFIKTWNETFKCQCEEKEYKEKSCVVTIVETQSGGEGEIYLKFNLTNPAQQFILQCDLSIGSNSSYLKSNKQPDGLVLFVDLSKKSIHVYIVELKTNITNKLQVANRQINTLFYFIKSLFLEKCFDVCYFCILGYKKCQMQHLALHLNPQNRFNTKLYQGFLESCEKEKGYMPIQYPFCTFETYELISVKFYETIELEIKQCKK